MGKTIIIATIAALASACAPSSGSGSGAGLEAHTGWRGLLSAGPASADGAIKCGVPDRQFFACDEGASVKRGDTWLGCVEPGQTSIGGNGSEARGDFVQIRQDGTVVFVGNTTAGVLTRAACISQTDAPVAHAWAGQVLEIRQGFPKVEEVCWDPDTGAAADCAELGR